MNPRTVEATTRTEKFSKSTVASLSPSGKEYWVKDTEVSGLAIRVSAAGNGTFYLTKKIDGRLMRVRIASVTEITHKKAREEATRIAASMTLTGENPNKKKRDRRRKKATLEDAYSDYVDGRGVKGGTLENYERSMRMYLCRWKNRELSEISRDEVRRHYLACSKKSASATTSAFRLLRAIFNYADGNYLDTDGKPILLDNPVKELSRKRLWSKSKARSSRLRRDDFAKWFKALNTVEPILADYLQFVLLTGLRRREASTLKWNQVDFSSDVPSVCIEDTKNGRPLVVPLSNAAVAILRDRKNDSDSIWVFASCRSKSGHIEEPKSSVAKIESVSGINVSPHALRRTYISIAESIDIGPYTIKRLVNHSSGRDVTEAHYIDIEMPRLLEATQYITDTILSYKDNPVRINAIGNHEPQVS